MTSFSLLRAVPRSVWLAGVGIACAACGVMTGAAWRSDALAWVSLYLILALPIFVVLWVPLYVVARRVRLTIEPERLRVREGLGRAFDVPTSSIRGVSANGRFVTIERDGAEALEYAVAPLWQTHGRVIEPPEHAAAAKSLAEAIERVLPRR